MASILLLEDDVKMAAELKTFLQNQGQACDVVYDGQVFFKQTQLAAYDLFILDINVPLLNGLEVCKKIRAKDNQVPILMLTAYSSVEDKVEALEWGADDYLVKPFHLDELMARVKALLRRSITPQKEADLIYTVADLVINATEMRVERAGKLITLTPKEYKLIELLASAKGRTVSKQTIAEQVWDIHFETGTNTIEVYINLLRNKVDKNFSTPLIHTRPGYGYYLKDTK
ncbi:MAG: response regulator transcription factor [Williamsia sp.]|nr:response regulator transcription factor [Williamsia sp.]